MMNRDPSYLIFTTDGVSPFLTRQLNGLWKDVHTFSVDDQGMLHSFNGNPSVIVGYSNNKIYTFHGTLHRIDGPSLVGINKIWYCMGKQIDIHAFIQASVFYFTKGGLVC